MHIHCSLKIICTQAELRSQAAAAKDAPPIQCRGLQTTGSMLASLQAAEPGLGWSSDPTLCHHWRQHRWWKWPCPCWLGAPTCRGGQHRIGTQSTSGPQHVHFSRCFFLFVPEHIHAKGVAFAQAKPSDFTESADMVCKTLTAQ